MQKNDEGHWVDGRTAVAKYHLQARCNAKMMEMTCHYLDQLCGDGTPPKVTTMTAKARVDKETGELLEPKQTTVKKYSFTYAMAWDRLSSGRGLVSRFDRQTLELLSLLIAASRRLTPVTSIGDDLMGEIEAWREKLRSIHEFVDNGQKPVYLTQRLRRSPEQLQAAMKVCHPAPDGTWRVDLDQLRDKLRALDADCPSEPKEADKWWWQQGRLDYSAHYNIRTGRRFTGEGFDSKAVRDALEWIWEVPSVTTPMDREAINHDLGLVDDWRNEVQKFREIKKPTSADKEEVVSFLRVLVPALSTARNGFIRD